MQNNDQPKNKTEAFTKSMNINIWAIGTLNQLFIGHSCTQIKFFKKWSSQWQKPIFLWKAYFELTIQFVLTLAFDRTVLNGNVALSFTVLWTKKSYSNLLRKVLVFQKTYFKVKVLKMFKIPSDCHIKTRRYLKRRAILKIPCTAF